MIVNLTALAETRAKMTPGEYRVPDRHASIFVEAGGFGRQLASMCGHGILEDEERDVNVRMLSNAEGLVATHNASDVLIEVARTLLAYNATKSEYTRIRCSLARHSTYQTVNAVNEAASVMHRAQLAHEQALAKVTV